MSWNRTGAAERLALPLLARLAGIASGQRRNGRLFVLIYHQVLDRPDPMRKGEVDSERFAAQMDLVADYFNVLPLAHAIRMLRAGRLPRRALSITFDDGYRNNYTNALPILEARGLKATFFVATGFLDGGRMWNDTVIESFRSSACPTVDLPEIGLDGVSLDSMPSRAAAAEKAIGAIKHLPFGERADWVARIVERLAPESLPDNLMMSNEQVAALKQRGMEIGGHTVNHPILARLGEDEARREIVEGKARLEEIIGDKVRIFAYPNGKRGGDYTDRDVGLVEKAGFEAAVSTNPGASQRGDSPYEIRRFTPWDRTPERFLLRITRYYRL